MEGKLRLNQPLRSDLSRPTFVLTSECLTMAATTEITDIIAENRAITKIYGIQAMEHQFGLMSIETFNGIFNPDYYADGDDVTIYEQIHKSFWEYDVLSIRGAVALCTMAVSRMCMELPQERIDPVPPANERILSDEDLDDDWCIDLLDIMREIVTDLVRQIHPPPPEQPEFGELDVGPILVLSSPSSFPYAFKFITENGSHKAYILIHSPESESNATVTSTSLHHALTNTKHEGSPLRLSPAKIWPILEL
ncbi:hypothetical protein M422DRAFT_242547 [Sphaerobolus stellatus SS14]|nr:hypothetical protein M422DRAFT_242547 [Sphaerobolus stellatus SS14]